VPSNSRGEGSLQPACRTPEAIYVRSFCYKFYLLLYNQCLGTSPSVRVADALKISVVAIMRFLRLVSALTALLLTCNATNNGLMDIVSWDPYSLVVNGNRTFIL